MAEPREIHLHMAEPDPEAPTFIRIGASQRMICIATSGPFESTGEITQFMREVADELDSGACG